MGKEMLKRCLRTPLILLMTGTFISATQASLAGPLSGEGESSSGTCFAEKGMLDLSGLAVESNSLFPAAGGSLSAAAAADTLETYEIELEDEGKKTNYKAIVGFAIAAAFIGYAIYIMIVPDEEEEAPADPPGKEPPAALITIPFGG